MRVPTNTPVTYTAPTGGIHKLAPMNPSDPITTRTSIGPIHTRPPSNPSSVEKDIQTLSTKISSPGARLKAKLRYAQSTLKEFCRPNIQRCVLSLGDDTAVVNSAKSLASKFRYKAFDASNPPGIQDKLTLVGHGTEDGKTFGGKTAQQVLDHLKANNIQGLSHLSLKGCHSAVFARDLMALMQEQGFPIETVSGRSSAMLVNKEGQSLVTTKAGFKHHSEGTKIVVHNDLKVHDPYEDMTQSSSDAQAMLEKGHDGVLANNLGSWLNDAYGFLSQNDVPKVLERCQAILTSVDPKPTKTEQLYVAELMYRAAPTQKGAVISLVQSVLNAGHPDQPATPKEGFQAAKVLFIIGEPNAARVMGAVQAKAETANDFSTLIDMARFYQTSIPHGQFEAQACFGKGLTCLETTLKSAPSPQAVLNLSETLFRGAQMFGKAAVKPELLNLVLQTNKAVIGASGATLEQKIEAYGNLSQTAQMMSPPEQTSVVDTLITSGAALIRGQLPPAMVSHENFQELVASFQEVLSLNSPLKPQLVAAVHQVTSDTATFLSAQVSPDPELLLHSVRTQMDLLSHTLDNPTHQSEAKQVFTQCITFTQGCLAHSDTAIKEDAFHGLLHGVQLAVKIKDPVIVDQLVTLAGKTVQALKDPALTNAFVGRSLLASKLIAATSPELSNKLVLQVKDIISKSGNARWAFQAAERCRGFNPDLAVAFSRMAVQINAQSAQNSLELGDLAGSLDSLQESIQSAKLVNDSSSLSTLDSQLDHLFQAAIKTEDFDLALHILKTKTDYRDKAGLAVSISGPLQALADIQWKNGNPEEALDVLGFMISLEPDPGKKIALGTAMLQQGMSALEYKQDPMAPGQPYPFAALKSIEMALGITKDIKIGIENEVRQAAKTTVPAPNESDIKQLIQAKTNSSLVSLLTPIQACIPILGRLLPSQTQELVPIFNDIIGTQSVLKTPNLVLNIRPDLLSGRQVLTSYPTQFKEQDKITQAYQMQDITMVHYQSTGSETRLKDPIDKFSAIVAEKTQIAYQEMVTGSLGSWQSNGHFERLMEMQDSWSTVKTLVATMPSGTDPAHKAKLQEALFYDIQKMKTVLGKKDLDDKPYNADLKLRMAAASSSGTFDKDAFLAERLNLHNTTPKALEYAAKRSMGMLNALAGYLIEGRTYQLMTNENPWFSKNLEWSDQDTGILGKSTRPDMSVKMMDSGKTLLLDFTAFNSQGHIFNKTPSWVASAKVADSVEVLYPSFDKELLKDILLEDSGSLTPEQIANKREAFKLQQEAQSQEKQRDKNLVVAFREDNNAFLKIVGGKSAAYHLLRSQGALTKSYQSKSDPKTLNKATAETALKRLQGHVRTLTQALNTQITQTPEGDEKKRLVLQLQGLNMLLPTA